MNRRIVLACLLAVAITGCGTHAAPDWTATPSPQPTLTATPSDTPTLAPTHTTTPLPTATATAQPTATPTAAPSDTPAPTTAPTDPPAVTAQTGDAAAGEILFHDGSGAGAPPCSTCHAAAPGPFALGPAMTGISARAGARVEGLSAEAYLRQSILEPHAFLVPGFRPVMPGSYAEHLTDTQIADIIAYLMTR